jgi:hypothetical protein
MGAAPHHRRLAFSDEELDEHHFETRCDLDRLETLIRGAYACLLDA